MPHLQAMDNKCILLMKPLNYLLPILTYFVFYRETSDYEEEPSDDTKSVKTNDENKK